MENHVPAPEPGLELGDLDARGDGDHSLATRSRDGPAPGLSVGRLEGEDRGLRGDSGLGYDDSGKAPDEIGPGRGQRLHAGQPRRVFPGRPAQTTDEGAA